MPNLLVTGSIALDRIAVFRDRFANHILPEKVHRLNVAFTVQDMTENFGGTGGNIAYNLSLLGEQPILLGAAGYDGKKYLARLKKQKVNCDHVYISADKLTAHATVMTDMDDNQITAFYEGAMAEAYKSQIKNLNTAGSAIRNSISNTNTAGSAIRNSISNTNTAGSAIRNSISNTNAAGSAALSGTCSGRYTEISLAIIAPNNPAAMVQYADDCRKNKIRFIADPGQAIPALSAKELGDLITGAHVLICNDYEWAMIQEKTGLDLKSVLSKVNYLIITYGEDGAKIWRKDDASVIDVPAVKPKELIDPTGCGDAYRAGLMYGISNGYTIEKSAQIGAWLAARAIEKAGTQNHRIKKSDFKKFLIKLQKLQ
jgi:adenosine kinase